MKEKKMNEILIELNKLFTTAKTLIDELSNFGMPLMLNHFNYGTYKSKAEFYPSSVIEKFFDLKYPKRKLGSQLLSEGFTRGSETLNGVLVNGYYLNPHTTADWVKINDIKTQMYGG